MKAIPTLGQTMASSTEATLNSSYILLANIPKSDLIPDLELLYLALPPPF